MARGPVAAEWAKLVLGVRRQPGVESAWARQAQALLAAAQKPEV
jgi:hypothetical protein